MSSHAKADRLVSLHFHDSTRTDTSPFPPLASPSLRPLGCLFIASRLFCWYSSSIVMAATPFAMAPVIREAAPAIPPERQIGVSITFISPVLYMNTDKTRENLENAGKDFSVCYCWSIYDEAWTYLRPLPPELSPQEPFLQQTPRVPGWLPGTVVRVTQLDKNKTQLLIGIFFYITNLSDGSYTDQTKALAFTCVSFQHSYLIRLIEESFKSFWQPSDQAKRIPEYVQAKHQHVHLFNSLKY